MAATRPGAVDSLAMNRELRELIDAAGGAATLADLRRAVPRHILDHAVRTRRLVRTFPRTYTDPARLSDPWTRVRAAVGYAGPGAALSHVTALAVWQLPGGDLSGPIHVLVDRTRRLRATNGIVVHRRRGFTAEPPEVVIRAGSPVCCLERCVVDCWRLLSPDARRAAVIGAVGDRRTTPGRLLAAIGANINLPDRAELVRLVNLLERGCRSELELWGYEGVFAGPGMPEVEWNVAVRLENRTIYLDTYCRAARVNFELDGAKWHTSRTDRERDARRDAALAAMGIMVVRFTHDQLIHRPDEVRAQIRAIVAARLGSATA